MRRYLTIRRQPAYVTTTQYWPHHYSTSLHPVLYSMPLYFISSSMWLVHTELMLPHSPQIAHISQSLHYGSYLTWLGWGEVMLSIPCHLDFYTHKHKIQTFINFKIKNPEFSWIYRIPIRNTSFCHTGNILSTTDSVEMKETNVNYPHFVSIYHEETWAEGKSEKRFLTNHCSSLHHTNLIPDGEHSHWWIWITWFVVSWLILMDWMSLLFWKATLGNTTVLA